VGSARKAGAIEQLRVARTGMGGASLAALERARIIDERERDLRRMDEELGLVKPHQPLPRLPLAEATPRLRRRPGEKTWVDFWAELASQAGSGRRE
jgi:hypothetical protein